MSTGRWRSKPSIRSAITLEQRGNGQLVAYFGDQAANVYAVDAKVGKVLWKVEVDEHPHAAITAAPQLYNGRLYVPVSSREESQVGDPRYPCCSFRGSVVALDAATGKRRLEDLLCGPDASSDREEQHRHATLWPGRRRDLEHADDRYQTQRPVRRDRQQLRAAGDRIVGFASRARPGYRQRSAGRAR